MALNEMNKQNLVKIMKNPLGELKSGTFQQISNNNDANIEAGAMKGLQGKRKGGKGEPKGRNKTPQAIAVARRNARERNRVKQVNNGFSALRQHIPHEIAELFEQPPKGSASSSSASAKKLSKVETLRMAVEYIRHLESMLSCDSASSSSSVGGLINTSNSSIESNSYLPATPPPETSNLHEGQPTYFYAIKPHRSSFVVDEIIPQKTSISSQIDTQIAIINGQQFVRIGANTFQLVLQQQQQTQDSLMYKEEEIEENNENIKPDFEVLPAGSIVQQHQHHQHQPLMIESSSQASSVMISVDSIKQEPTLSQTNSFIAITPALLQQMKTETTAFVTETHPYMEEDEEMLFSTDSTSNDWQDMS